MTMRLQSEAASSDVTVDSVFRIGKVVSVDGRRIQIKVDKSKNGSHLIFQGDLLRNVSVGGYVKITKGFSEIIGKVDGESIVEDQRESVRPYKSKLDRQNRLLQVSLVGFLTTKGIFKRGVRELPLIDNECFLLTRDEFDCIHQFVAEEDNALPLGTLAMEKGQPVSVGVNALMASHIGIFGNTGSGKSYTLAKIYHELLNAYKDKAGFQNDAHFLLIDFNGEYVNKPVDGDDETSSKVIIEDEYKKTYVLSTANNRGDKIPLNQKAINDPAFWVVLLDATEKTQTPFIQRTLESDYWESKFQTPQDLTNILAELIYAATKNSDSSFDKNVVMNFLNEINVCLGRNAALETLIEDYNSNLGFHGMQKVFYYRRSGGTDIYANNTAHDAAWKEEILEKIQALPLVYTGLKDIDLVRFKIVVQYYSDIIRGFANREHIGPLIKRLESRVSELKKVVKIGRSRLLSKSLTVISLRDVNLNMRKIVPMMLCKYLYEDKKVTDPKNKKYLNIIIDEAHNILSSDSVRESESWRDYRLETFEEIIKEGRKFGVFLTIASQRPHDISETIISQLHNYFLHRLINNLDIHAIEKAVAYLDKVSFDALPIQPTGTCIMSGISSQIPVIVDIDKIPKEYEPNNKTMTLTDKWDV